MAASTSGRADSHVDAAGPIADHSIFPRVTMVIEGLGAGGAERVLVSLANHWVQQQYGVTLLSCSAPSEPYYHLDPEVVLRHLDVTIGRSEAPLPIAASRLARRICVLRAAIRASTPDIVLSFLTKTNVSTLLATRALNVPVIVSERNNPARQDLGASWRWLRDRLYPRAACVVCQTQQALRCLPEAVQWRARVIPNPVIVPAIRPLHRSSRVIAGVGRLEAQKGFDLLIRAFSEIASDYPDWSLVIWGDGKRRAELEALVGQLALHGRVSLPGVTAHPGEWIERAEVFVLSSRYEGFSNALAEAMAAGLPVVAFDCPWSPRELITHQIDGLLLPPEDTKALAEALRCLLVNPPLRMQLGEAARRTVARLDANRILPMWEELIAETMQGVQPSSYNSYTRPTKS